MHTPDHHDDQQDEAIQAPPRLVSALKRLAPQPVFIPPTTDEAILRAAHRHLVHPQKPQFKRFLAIPWLAATAALLLLLAVVPQFLRKPAPGPTGGSKFAREDLNHDGQVDILDAFALARQLKSGQVANPKLDINGDGVVDERDVTSLAAGAVKLEKGS